MREKNTAEKGIATGSKKGPPENVTHPTDCPPGATRKSPPNKVGNQKKPTGKAKIGQRKGGPPGCVG